MSNSQPISRRTLLKTVSAGFGYVAFAALVAEEAAGPLAPKQPHFAVRAK